MLPLTTTLNRDARIEEHEGTCATDCLILDGVVAHPKSRSMDP